MKTLLLIPSVAKTDIRDDVAAGLHPSMDYHALEAALNKDPGDSVEIFDYGVVERHRGLAIRLARVLAGRDAALALLGFLSRRYYDAVFTNGENVGIPLALLFRLVRRRPAHVTIGHRLSTGKKRLFFTVLKAHRQIDTIFVYATTQYDFAVNRLGIPQGQLSLIAFHADHAFYHPRPESPVNENQICSAGLEWRDYPTLISAVAPMPELCVKLAAASPWSKHTDETANRVLPQNVEARRYEYGELRDLYARSSFVVIPLYENDFQAGVTTILESMAMGKAVIVTRTTGQTDVVVDGENGLVVAPGDTEGLRRAIDRLRTDPALRARLAANGRLWIEQHGTLERWVQQITGALRGASGAARKLALSREHVKISHS